MYRLTRSLPYLLNRVGVRLGQLFSLELEQLGLTLPMYQVLAGLHETDKQRLTDLSEITGTELTTLSRLTSAMQRRGLIIRYRPEANMRTVLLSLTEQGRAVIEEVFPRAEHYVTTMTRGIEPVDVGRMQDWLRVLLRNLDQLDPVADLDCIDHSTGAGRLAEPSIATAPKSERKM